MDLTPLFKAYIKSIKIQNKGFIVAEKSKTTKNDLMVKCHEIRQQITQLRNFLVENRASYMHYACHLKKSSQMSNEERDVIDKETEKIVSICTQYIWKLKKEYGQQKVLSNQHRHHVNAVLELLAHYLKAVYNIFSDQKNMRISRDLESYKFLKLHAVQKSMETIEYNDMDLYSNNNSNDSFSLNDKELPAAAYNESVVRRRIKNQDSKKEPKTVQFFEDDQENSHANGEDLQMLEIENKQLLSSYKGLTEEVQQIERHVYDISKLQEIFTEKVVVQRNEIERVHEAVFASTENVKEANEQIREATQRNAGLRVYILFFLIVMSFSLLFLDWYNE